MLNKSPRKKEKKRKKKEKMASTATSKRFREIKPSSEVVYDDVLKRFRSVKDERAAFSLEKIISGGQTGADRAALRAAKVLGFATGGMAPPNYRTSAGYDRALATEYGLSQFVGKSVSAAAGYVARSRHNVDAADATLAFRVRSSVGTDKTIGYCQTGEWVMCKEVPALYRPVLIISDAVRLVQPPLPPPPQKTGAFVRPQPLRVGDIAKAFSPPQPLEAGETSRVGDIAKAFSPSQPLEAGETLRVGDIAKFFVRPQPLRVGETLRIEEISKSLLAFPPQPLKTGETSESLQLQGKEEEEESSILKADEAHSLSWVLDAHNLRAFIIDNNVRTLNVCGHRQELFDPTWEQRVTEFLIYALSPCVAPPPPAEDKTPVQTFFPLQKL